MTDRMKATIVMLVYLLCCSVLFGAMFSNKHILMGLLFGIIGQGLAVYLLVLTHKTEPK